MNMFGKLLRILQRDFTLENETDHGNGFVQQRYSDGLDTYEVEVYEGVERTIIAPTKTQYYAYGEKQEFPNHENNNAPSSTPAPRRAR
jgi:hypothetical protein